MGSLVSALSSGLRLLTLMVLVSIAPSAIGWSIGGPRGLWAGLAAAVGFVLLACCLSERLVTRALGGSRESQQGLSRTLARAAGKSGIRIAVFPEAAAEAVVVRSWFSPGTILLSQGLVARASEDELCQIFELAERVRAGSALPIATLAAWFAATSLALAPKQWNRLALLGNVQNTGRRNRLGPFALLLFWMLYPMARTVMALGGAPQSRLRPNDEIWDGAMRKMRATPVFRPVFGITSPSKISIVDRTQ